MEKTCEVCGLTFHAKTNGKYCSDPCRAIVRKSKEIKYRSTPEVRERMRENSRRHHARWLDERRERSRLNYLAKKDVISERKAQYYRDNPDRLREHRRVSAQKQMEGYRAGQARIAQLRNTIMINQLTGDLTHDQ